MVSFVRVQFPFAKMEHTVDNQELFRRRQAVRRKGFVFQRAQSLARIAEGRGNSPSSSSSISGTLKTRHSGSSLDLAPSLLSIYDSIALASKKTEDEADRSQNHTSTSTANQNNSPRSISSNQNSSLSSTPSIRVESDQPKCDMNHSRVEGGDEGVTDSKKRPLSISSMSSSSSSSLPRHIRKRPNLCEYDPVGRGDMEKLDSLLYIDDDAPSGTTDEEMSVDTDGESSRKCDNLADKDGTSIQSSASLSSENDSVGKSTPSHQNGLAACENDLTVTSEEGHDQYNDSVNISYSSPVHGSFNTSTDISVTSPATPVLSGATVSQGTTPRSRRSSLNRDSTSPSKYVTYVQRVVAEIVETERIYVRYLQEIIDGYLEFLRQSTHPKVSDRDRNCLFGNIQEIYEFSRSFLADLEQCDDDPLKVADCFVRNNEGFAIYAQYCTNYPSAVEVLMRVMMDPDLCEMFKNQQQTLGHNLPLGSYLLKPVQRVLKYHLLLHNILKNYDKNDLGYEIMSQALSHMTGMAQHINEMKRKHEHAVRVQEIQSQLEEYEGEDLTRIGELVLEGSFRIYGAKTSRHVFLFEKGILIAKKKEDSMLSSKGVILCSNLMLVESLPKEPLSFQIIPFDNPRGQHTLQARNLEQKRKWCQEIKRQIIESYKDKIPEKVKGLVMQLGKSKEEDGAKPADFGAKKIHHHTAPEYLEKRHRMRRKSGTLIPDILKPQRRKGQMRPESASPRESPMSQRKYRPVDAASRTPNLKDQGEVCYSSSGEINSPISRDTTASDLSSISTLTSDGDLPTADHSGGNMMGRSCSFKSAVRGRSQSMELEEDLMEADPSQKEVDAITRRSRSFRIATRMKPIRSVDLGDERISTSGPNTPVGKKEMDFGMTTKADRPSSHTSIPESGSQVSVNSFVVLNHGLSRSEAYSSMPVLSVVDRGMESPVNGQHESNRCGSSSSSSQHPTGNSFGVLLPQPKRIIDIKQYFAVNQERKLRTTEEPEESTRNLRRDGNSVSAFHDTFRKTSMESLPSRSINQVPRVISHARPFPLSASLSSDKVMTSSSCSNVQMQDSSPGFTVGEDNPWIPSTSTDFGQYKDKTGRRRAHSTDGELDSLDWMVYANRNSLPVTGFSTEDIPKLYKNYPPSHTEIDRCNSENVFNAYSNNYRNQQYQSSCHCAYGTPPRSAISTTVMDRHSDTRYSLPAQISPYDSDSDELSTLGTLPHIQKHRPLTRSNSTPCARVSTHYNLKGARSSSFDMDKVIFDHEKIVAEMEEYLKKSDSTLSLEAQKFPTNIIPVTSDEETTIHTPNRDSFASNLSSSSYESQDSYDTHDTPQNDSIVDTLKTKIHDFTNMLTHRRSGSYDNKHLGVSDQENDLEFEKHGNPSSHRHSLLSLNSWFASKPKEGEPDIHSVLQAGELGGSMIGQRMAQSKPDFLGRGLSLTRRHEKVPVACAYDMDESSDLPQMDSEQSKDNSTLLNLQNLNIQQCDSAFSIGDSCNSDESPRSSDDKDEKRRMSKSDSSGDSFYERRLSMAFDEGDAFRDSAVYCEMDIDPVDVPDPAHDPDSFSPVSSVIDSISPVPKYTPPNLPIKAYVQRLGGTFQIKSKENVVPPPLNPQPRRDSGEKPRNYSAVQVKREPGSMVRKTMENLQQNVNRRSSSRAFSEERDTPSYSRMASEERDINPFTGRFSFKRASTPCKSEDHFFVRESSDPVHVYRNPSDPAGSGALKPSRSLSRLDQLNSDADNLIIMKGWVRQLIQKFQSAKS